MVPAQEILISDPKIIEIPVQENHEQLVDLRKFSEFFVDTRKKSDQKSYFKIRKSVADKLINAAKNLPDGYRFLIIEGYRPLSVQKQYFDEYTSELNKLHPDWINEKIYAETCKFVAPPDKLPPHCTGSAIDLTLADSAGKEIDMGVVINADPENSNNACYTMATNISDEAKINRQILIDALNNEGFVNYQFEIWHWSYGDRWWAYHTKNQFAIYGAIKDNLWSRLFTNK